MNGRDDYGTHSSLLDLVWLDKWGMGMWLCYSLQHRGRCSVVGSLPDIAHNGQSSGSEQHIQLCGVYTSIFNVDHKLQT